MLRHLQTITTLILMACAAPADEGDRWFGATVTHEGAPLALRVRPDVSTPTNRARWSHVVAVTLTFTQVRADGLPEPAYSETLFSLDTAVIALLDADNEGAVVIIETGGGKRTWYSYAGAEAAAKRTLASLEVAHPGQQLEIWAMPDSSWKLFDEYRRLFGF